MTVRLFLLSFATLAVLHVVALELYLYWRHEWLDMPMHAFGGAIVALGVFAARDLRIMLLTMPPTFFRTLAIVLLVATTWEAYEYFMGISTAADYGVWIDDTILDFIFGMLGGALGYVVGKHLDRLHTL